MSKKSNIVHGESTTVSFFFFERVVTTVSSWSNENRETASGLTAEDHFEPKGEKKEEVAIPYIKITNNKKLKKRENVKPPHFYSTHSPRV